MNKASLLAALTNLHEKPLDYPQWGLSGVLLREFTARERQFANDAVQAEAGDGDVDQILFRAMLMQRCLTDPESGRPYADGRLGADGQPLIDPRSRAPIFTVEEIQEIADGRAILFGRIWDDLLELAALGPQAMFSGSHPDEPGERDQGAGAEGAADTAEGSESQGSGRADRRTKVADRAEPEAGDAAPDDAGYAVE